jgi:hypothetical protein
MSYQQFLDIVRDLKCATCTARTLNSIADACADGWLVSVESGSIVAHCPTCSQNERKDLSIAVDKWQKERAN